MMKGFLPGWWVALGLAGAACADNGRDVGFLSSSGGQNASQNVTSGGAGSAAKGGSSGKGGSPGGGAAQGGASGAGGSRANDTAGGKPGSGGRSGGSGGSGGQMVDASSPPSNGGSSPSHRDAATDASGLPLCGAYPCLSTTCVGIGCGLGRCCETDSGPLCVHGATRCPGEPAEVTLQCWSGTPAKATATFDKSCKVDGDCVVGDHWTGCCSISVVGIAASQKTSFDAFEQQTCGGPPPCGCCCDHLTAEDGNPVTPPATGRAICFSGSCMAVWQ